MGRRMRLTYPTPKCNNAHTHHHTHVYTRSPLVQVMGNKLHQSLGGEKHLQHTSIQAVHQMLIKVYVVLFVNLLIEYRINIMLFPY